MRRRSNTEKFILVIHACALKFTGAHHHLSPDKCLFFFPLSISSSIHLQIYIQTKDNYCKRGQEKVANPLFKTSVFGLKVCAPCFPQFLCWNLTPKVKIFGDGAFRRWLSHGAELSGMGLAPLPPLHRRLSLDTEIDDASTLISGFQPPNLREIKPQLFNATHGILW